ncbi:uncharacterized protein LOC143510810 [Brachyhypopomus gauderio]|uniref:uncharacterized protein LOC143510810 n=1 Tax=Brachyhypopomus gauderio TaxID=698409 RepID=UPI0040437ABF
MDAVQQHEAEDVRPKRRLRLPTRYEDYEVALAGYHPHRHGHDDGRNPYQEGRAKMTTLNYTHGSPRHQPVGYDEDWTEADACYPGTSLTLEAEDQRASQLRSDQVYRGATRDYSTPHPYSLSRQPEEDIRVELEEIQHERLLLRQSQQRISSDLAELRSIRADMKELVDTARHFQSDQSPLHSTQLKQDACVSRQDPTPAQMWPSCKSEPDIEEDDWPAPPSWPDNSEEVQPSSDQPLTDRLDQMIRELQALKMEAQATDKSIHLKAKTSPQAPVRNANADGGRHSRGTTHSPQVVSTRTTAPPPSSWTLPMRSQRLERQSTVPQPAAPARSRPPLHTQSLHHSSSVAETSYRGPRPTIPNFTNRDPSEFARLKIALENLLPADGTELFKYQVLVDHLKLEEATLIADAYLHSPTPYTDTMAALSDKFGQPHQVALKRIATVMDSPDVRRGDTAAFEKFALQIQSLVGMLRTLGPEGEVELQCGSHVARLLSKLPTEQRAEFRRRMFYHSGTSYTLLDLAAWLNYEAWCQDFDGQLPAKGTREGQRPRLEPRQGRRSATVLHGAGEATKKESTPPKQAFSQGKSQPYCPFCDSSEHYLSQCTAISKLTKTQVADWIRTSRRCWRCARRHQAAQCNLKKACGLCQGKHLQVLHEVNARSLKGPAKLAAMEKPSESSTTEVLYLDRPTAGSRVLLKVVRILIHHGNQTLDTFAVLDDGSERTMLLPAATDRLSLQGAPEDLSLRTIRQDVQTLHGASVSFSISSPANPKRKYRITGAFTAARIDLADHTYPMEQLQRKYKHLVGLPIQPFKTVRPLLLIGSDHPHLITPMEPVRLGPPGGPAAVRTRLGWVLQGPASMVHQTACPHQCLVTSVPTQVNELMGYVEKLWQVDTVPFRSDKLVTRSRQDHEAVSLLEMRTSRVDVDGVLRYATPLLRHTNMPCLQATKDAVMPCLRRVERRLSRDPEWASAYKAEMGKLIQAGSVKKLETQQLSEEGEAWYVPHHMVSHNGKNRLVFNCSYQYQGQSLNEHLLPGPTLGASLLGVLLRFREHATAISGDIKGMFHQVRLLPEDRVLLRFIWRDLAQNEPVAVYEWQVLPFGTTCSPCCATFALQRHVTDNSQPGDEVRSSVKRCFYVDNCLQSFPTVTEARHLIDQLRPLLLSAGFDLRQWASNEPGAISHLPEEARSNSAELWLSLEKVDSPESTLGLSWNFQEDLLGYKHRPVHYGVPTMRNIYKVLASQYDPLGFILPYTTRAKMLVRHLWDKHRGWDDPNLPPDLLQQWRDWEEELQFLPLVVLPRPYLPKDADLSDVQREVHVFCDASEQAYGSVAYLRTVDGQGQTYLSFLLGRSRVAPKRLLSIPRLELCAALTGAQLSQIVQRELTLNIDRTVLWSDSTTVLTWLKSESCRFKVFVGTRVAEIQDLTDPHAWRYVDSARNPADDITRGRTLQQLAEANRWSQGPSFLLQSPDQWPEQHTTALGDDLTEVRRSTTCGTASAVLNSSDADHSEFHTWGELLESTARELCGTGDKSSQPTAEHYRDAEQVILSRAQLSSFPEEFHRLRDGKPIPKSSRLIALSPEFDGSVELIRVGGRLRRSEHLEFNTLHPIILEPAHPTTKLLIQDFDRRLRHPGPERVLAEIRRSYWILRGREAIRRLQSSCADCRRWKSKPAVPKMADLPAARLRLFKPAFYSTGMDCFGPLGVKVGRRAEKRWGIVFKCLTTRAVHLDILTSIDTDSFLMALRRFIARRGRPAELFSDQGTNFRGGERELREAFTTLSPVLQQQLSKQMISFHFNPPAAPHFGGAWEREIRSVKTALYTTVGAQAVSEEVLRTVLLEVEGILNSKPLGYVSSDARDPDPVTPNVLLMGRPDGSLPQVVYPKDELLSRRHWRHSQVLADHFWSSFIRSYLPGLQSRQKWRSTLADLTEDSVVMIVDPQLPRALWPIGRVIKVHPSPDGRIRSADVQVKDRVYTRPVARLVLLPALPSDEDEKSPAAPTSVQP